MMRLASTPMIILICSGILFLFSVHLFGNLREKFVIETTLRNTDGDIERASKLLKIGKSTLRYKIKKYEISAERRNT